MAPISQREARRLQKRVSQLEEAFYRQRQGWATDYFCASQIASAQWSPEQPVPMAVRTAHTLHHAVVVTVDDSGLVRFMALPHPAEVSR